MVDQPGGSDDPEDSLRRAERTDTSSDTRTLSAAVSRPHWLRPSHLRSHPELLNVDTLPAPLTPLIGRQQEVATVCALLRRAQVRLLVLTGPGGIGKTRMALQIATDLRQDFPAGVCFVSLEPLRDPALVAPTIANALGLRESARESVLDQLKGSLREQHLLLLLDNFEQVAAAAPLLSELLAACPKLKVLVSSRTRLHIRGEHEWVVPPLALPDPKQLADSGALSQYAAVALFLQCAWAIQPEFQISQYQYPRHCRDLSTAGRGATGD